MLSFDAYPGGVTLRKDTVETINNPDVFYHRIQNNSFLFDFTVNQQKLGVAEAERWNPLANLTWGGMMAGGNFSVHGNTSGTYVSIDFKGWSIKSDGPAREHHLKIFRHTDQNKSKISNKVWYAYG